MSGRIQFLSGLIIVTALLVSCDQEVRDEPGVPLQDVSHEERSQRNAVKNQITKSIILKVPLTADGLEDPSKAAFRALDWPVRNKTVDELVALFEAGTEFTGANRTQGGISTKWLSSFQPAESGACGTFKYCELKPSCLHDDLVWQFNATSFPAPGFEFHADEKKFHVYAWQRNWQ